MFQAAFVFRVRPSFPKDPSGIALYGRGRNEFLERWGGSGFSRKQAARNCIKQGFGVHSTMIAEMRTFCAVCIESVEKVCYPKCPST